MGGVRLLGIGWLALSMKKWRGLMLGLMGASPTYALERARLSAGLATEAPQRKRQGCNERSQ